ncbi:MAG: redoxin family protein [Thermomicrobiales bacterium]
MPAASPPDETPPVAPTSPAPADTTPAPVDPFAEDDQPDRDEVEHGRIGYSRYGRFSSIGLAALIVLGLVAVGIWNWGNSSNDSQGDDSSVPTPGVQANRPAPDFSLTLFDGSTFSLADQRGKIVVMNFWASWCEPCKEEMPVLEQAAESAPDDVVFVGVGAKNDKDDKARQFATDHGVTYAIGRDTAGGDQIRGQIEQDYRIPGYPATFVIDAEGNVVFAKIQPVTTEEIDQAIALARG